MSGRLVLVRHGETEGNVAKILDTRVPGLPLTERGAAQAKAFAATLSPVPRRLFSSQALRARQTAQHIEAITGVVAQALDGLSEVFVGELDGSASAEAHELFQTIYKSWHLGELDRRLPGGENGWDVLDRYLPVLEDLRRTYLLPGEDGDILVVSHGAAMRLVGMTIGGVAPPFTTNNHLDNTETIELLPRYAGTEFLGWECERWGRYTPPFGLDVAPHTDDPMG